MRSKWPLLVVVLALLTVAAFTTGCTQLGLGMRTDAQIASDVQARINADPNLPNKQITVQSGNAVVTLSGTVGSDMERSAAANDAAQVRGVKTVVNNLQVGSMAAQVTAPAAPQPVEAAAPAPAPARETYSAPRRSARRSEPPAPRAKVYNQEPAPAPAPAASSTLASSAPSNVTLAPQTPAAPAKVTVPDGTMLSVRLIDSIDTSKNRVGDVFRATLDSPVVVDDKVVVPAEADVQGRIVNANQAGHYAGQSMLALELTQLSVNGHTYPLRTDQFTRQGSSRGARTAKTVGGGAVLGAIIGGIAGGGKGAAIGAASGAGAGGAVEAVTKPEPVRLPSETVVNFRLQESVTVTPFSTSNRSTDRYGDNDRPRLERRPPPPQQP